MRYFYNFFRDCILDAGKHKSTYCKVKKSIILLRKRGLLAKAEQFIIRHMKYIMVAIFTVCMGGLFYLFTFAVSEMDKMIQNQLNLLWIGCILLLLASILSIWYACVLGSREDKAKRRKIELEIENLEIAKQQREEALRIAKKPSTFTFK